MGWKVKRRERYALIEVDEVNPRVHRCTFHIGPRHVKHHASKEFVEHAYTENPDFASEKDCRIFAQCSNIAVEVYDFYNKLFDPDYENVSVYDERFEVQYLFKEKPKEQWRSVDYYNSRIEVIPLNDGVDIKKTFDTDYGPETLEITYTVRTGARLKHTIVFTNKTAQQRTFRVVMKLAGITSDKVKHRQGEEQITEETHIVAPVMFFGEDNQHLKLSEYLWSLGETDGETLEWSPTTLRDIVLDVHAHGCKADIIIGNYTLAENESLLIDPDSDTWQVGAGADDGNEIGGVWYYNANGFSVGVDISSKIRHSAFRWISVGIPQGSTISSAYLKVYETLTGSSKDVEGRVYGIDEDNTDDFTNNPMSRDATSANIEWDPNWSPAQFSEHISPDVKTIVQEIVDRLGWSSGNALGVFWKDDGSGWNKYYTAGATYEHSEEAPKLEVTWEAPRGTDGFAELFAKANITLGLVASPASIANVCPLEIEVLTPSPTSTYAITNFSFHDLLGKFSTGPSTDSANLFGEADVQHSASVEFPGRADVRQPGSIDLFDKIDIRQPSSADLPGRGIIGHVGISELLGKTEIRHIGTPVELLGEFVVRHMGTPVELFGKGIVKNIGSVELLGKGEFQHSGSAELLGKTIIRHAAPPIELLGEADVQHSDSSELLVKGIITNIDSIDLLAEFVVGQDYSAGLFAKCVLRHKISANLLGKSVSRKTGSVELFGKFTVGILVSSAELPGKFEVRPGRGDAKQPGSAEISAKTEIRQSDYADLPGKIIIRQEVSVELLGKAEIRHVGTPVEIFGKAVIRHSDSEELFGKFRTTTDDWIVQGVSVEAYVALTVVV